MLRIRRTVADVRIVHRREHDEFRLRLQLRDLTTCLQSVDVGQVEVDHNYFGLESLRGFQQCAAVCDDPYDVAVQCQHPADGFRHARVVFG